MIKENRSISVQAGSTVFPNVELAQNACPGDGVRLRDLCRLPPAQEKSVRVLSMLVEGAASNSGEVQEYRPDISLVLFDRML